MRIKLLKSVMLRGKIAMPKTVCEVKTAFGRDLIAREIAEEVKPQPAKPEADK